MLLLSGGPERTWIVAGLVLLVLAAVALVPRRLPEDWLLVEAVAKLTRRRLVGVMAVMVIGAVAGGALAVAALRTRPGFLGAGIVHGVEVGAADGRSWTLLGRPAENRAVFAFLLTVCPQATAVER